METPHEEVPVAPRPLGATEARQLGAAARDRLFKQADAGKATLSGTLEKVVGPLEEVVDRLAAGEEGKEVPGQAFLGSLIKKARRVQRRLNDTPSRELVRDAEEAVRERPGAILAGCFALGFLGIRMLRT